MRSKASANFFFFFHFWCVHLIALAQGWRNRGEGAGRAHAPRKKIGRSDNPISTKGGRLCPLHYCSPPQIFRPSAILATAFSHAHRCCWSAINFSQNVFWGEKSSSAAPLTKLGAGPAEGLKIWGEGGKQLYLVFWLNNFRFLFDQNQDGSLAPLSPLPHGSAGPVV